MAENKLSAAILGAFPVASFVLDRERRVIHWNRACEILTGVAQQEMLGTQNHWQAFYPNQRMLMADLIVSGATEQLVDQLYHGKFRPSRAIPGTYEAEDFFPQLGEAGRWLYFTAAPLLDETGQVIGAIETLQDVTEKRCAEEALKASEERFKALSRTDPLTQLYNFRDFYEQIDQEVDRALRYRRPLSLAIIDVDNFKAINDRYGHLEGDRVLSQLGELIRSWKRCTDKAFRYGGDEFAVLMPEIGVDQAVLAAQRLKNRLMEGFGQTAIGSGALACTLSIGVSQYIPGEMATDWIARADAAAYRAKRFGRNCVVAGEADLAAVG